MLLLSVLFILFSLVSGEVRLCSTPIDTVCGTQNLQFPRNSFELTTICPAAIDYLECLHSYDVACAGRSRSRALPPPLYYERIKRYLDEACDQTSNLHRVLSRNLPCINGKLIRSDTICDKINGNVRRAYDKYVKNHPVQGNVLRINCLEEVTTAACILEDIEEECGFFAHEAVSDGLKSSQLLAYKCELDVFQELANAVPHLNISPELKESLLKQFVLVIE